MTDLSTGYRSSRSQRPPPDVINPFLPLLLLAAALVAWFGFQTYQLASESQQLTLLHAAQEAQVEAAGKVRASLDTVAAATARLADGGNVNARILVAELRRRGITINPIAATAATLK